MAMNPTGGLASLVAALQGGMDPGQAFGIVQYLEQEQANRMAQRAERLGGLSSLLTEAAGTGMPYDAANAMAEAAPGPAGPAVQNILASLYPTSADAMGGEGAYAGVPEMPGQVAPRETTPTAGFVGAQQSPVFTQNPQAQMAMAQQDMALQAQQAELMGAQQSAALDQDWATIMADAAKAKGQGWTPDQFVARAAQNPEYAAVMATDQERLKAILSNVFGGVAVQTAGAPAQLG